VIQRNLSQIGPMAGSRGGLPPSFGEVNVRGVSIDSRTIHPGNLYVPIVRIKDGHDFVEEAFAKGAAASLWQHDHPNPPSGVPLLFVDDCTEALQRLAAGYRSELPAKVIGVTGSNGKTTTKDMIESILGTMYKVHKTKGNLNSQIGVPLTILEMEPDTDVAVIEMGMSERGQIGRLSRLAQPDIAVITMIGVSHLSTLGSREAIAEAKLEIAAGLSEDGVLVYNGDERLLVEGVGRLERIPRTVRFGTDASHDLVPGEVGDDPGGTWFKLDDASYRISLLGRHNVNNALAAIAAARLLGIPEELIAAGLQAAKVTGMRMEVLHSSLGYTIINDAWNASPVSMKAAIETFEQLGGCGNKIMAAGDMLELGDRAAEFHREIGRMLNPERIQFVVTVGELGEEIAKEAAKAYPPGRVAAFRSREEAVGWIREIVKPSDAVLLKASRGMELEKAVDALL